MSLHRPSRATMLVGLLCFGALSSIVLSEEKPPVDVGAGTAVEVRLVTIDAVVLDKADRTVAGLGPADFALKVDGKAQAIETFDAECGAGSLDEPVARKRPTDPMLAYEKGEAPRRIVFALDYYHLLPPQRQAVFDYLRDAIKSGFAPGEELMIVAMANGLRVEQPFTTDRAQLFQSARRMEYDVTLWNGHFSHSTEDSTFQALDVLMEILAEVRGPKSVVLFSDGVWPTGADRDYDPEFVRMSAMAGNAGVTFYPVMSSGLLTLNVPST